VSDPFEKRLEPPQTRIRLQRFPQDQLGGDVESGRKRSHLRRPRTSSVLRPGLRRGSWATAICACSSNIWILSSPGTFLGQDALGLKLVASRSARIGAFVLRIPATERPHAGRTRQRSLVAHGRDLCHPQEDAPISIGFTPLRLTFRSLSHRW
jgi:hypothetical protein